MGEEVLSVQRAEARGKSWIKGSCLHKFDHTFQVRGAEPKICVVVCIVCFWWIYALKFVMLMMEIGGGLWIGTVVIEFWTKYMKEKGVMHSMCGNEVELGIWELYGVYTMPMWCCKLCKLIWYARILFGMFCGANWTRLEWVECVISEGIYISCSGELGLPFERLTQAKRMGFERHRLSLRRVRFA